MNVFAELLEAIAAEGAGALVSVTETEGSAPRQEGACMVMRPSGAFRGTIGGGALEWDALAEAEAALRAARGPARFLLRHLGPDLGQCCGGRVRLRIEAFDAHDVDELRRLADLVASGPGLLAASLDAEGRVLRRAAPEDLHRTAPTAGARLEPHGTDATPLLLFGAGHVGRALVLALAPLPFHIRWIDERPDAFPALVPANVEAVETRDVAAEIASAPQDARILVMTHSHALDLDIVAAALRAGRFPYVGLIGSATKRARFESRLRSMGLDELHFRRLVCPIGIGGISGKEPAIIAASVAAQLLLVRSAKE